MDEYMEVIKQNSVAKFDLLKTVVERGQRDETESELGLFFKSICKTVEKFNAIEQAKIKIEITTLVSNMQISKFQQNQAEIINSSDIIIIENSNTSQI